jgi:uncharacterized protein
MVLGSVLSSSMGRRAAGRRKPPSRYSKSLVRFDTDPNARALLGLNPDKLFG